MEDTPAAEISEEGTRPPRRRPLVILWAVVAVLSVGAGAIVVAAGDDDGPPRLPVALGAGAGDGRAEADTAAADAAMTMLAWVRYVAGEDLPALGGEAAAHRLSNVVDRARLGEVADALGLEGELVEQPGSPGSWQLEASDGSRLGAGPYGGGMWWYTSGAVLAEGDGSVSSSSGVACPDGDGVTDEELKRCEELAARDAEAAASAAAPDPFVPPADLPTEDEAERIALELFGGLGVDVEGARVTTEGPHDAWYVSIEPLVDGLVVSGYALHAAVGPKGEITTAGGVLNEPDHVGDYPTVDTRAAIDRLNEQMGGFGDGREPGIAQDATATDDIDCGTTRVAPADPGADPAVDPPVDPVCEPSPPAEPTEVVLHDAERILVLAPTHDDTDESYLVPGYRFRGDQEGWVDVIAVDDDSLLPPPPQPVEPMPLEPGEPGDGTNTEPGSAPGCAPVEPGPGGAVPDICLDPRSVEPAPPTSPGGDPVGDQDAPVDSPVGEP